MFPSVEISFRNKTFVHTRALEKTSPVQSDPSLPVSVWGFVDHFTWFSSSKMAASPLCSVHRGKRRGQRVILWLCLLSSFGLEFSIKDRAEPVSIHSVDTQILQVLLLHESYSRQRTKLSFWTRTQTESRLHLRLNHLHDTWSSTPTCKYLGVILRPEKPQNMQKMSTHNQRF